MNIQKFYTKYGLCHSLLNDEAFIRSLNEGKIYEEEFIVDKIIPIIKEYKKNDKLVILDIGGHIGSHTLIYSKLLPNSNIYVFEPQKVLYNILNLNIESNKLNNVIAFNNAVGHKLCNCTISKYLYDGYNCEIEYGIDKNMNYGGIHLGIGGESVNMITIDSLNLPSCDYIKIDVEGAEPLVLMGALNTIKKYKPIIFFENSDKIVNNEMKESLNIDFNVLSSIEILENENYKIYNIDENNKIAIFI